ncbi:MAG: hypothetical protein Q4F95_10875 [Oscillospiraceae bacterium]|nr:hypothetical protein [Oscillospiraceae bacterium]
MDFSFSVSPAGISKINSLSKSNISGVSEGSGDKISFSDILDSVTQTVQSSAVKDISQITVPIDTSDSVQIKELELGIKSQIISRAVEAYKNITEMQI